MFYIRHIKSNYFLWIWNGSTTLPLINLSIVFQEPFAESGIAILKTLVMATGEFEFEGMFVEPQVGILYVGTELEYFEEK